MRVKCLAQVLETDNSHRTHTGNYNKNNTIFLKWVKATQSKNLVQDTDTSTWDLTNMIALFRIR